MRQKSWRLWAALGLISTGSVLGTPACGSVDANLFTPTGAGSGGVGTTNMAGESGSAAVAGTASSTAGVGGTNQAGTSGGADAVSQGGNPELGGTAPSSGGHSSLGAGGSVASMGGSATAGTGPIAGSAGTSGASNGGMSSGGRSSGGRSGGGASGTGTSGGRSGGGAGMSNAGASGAGASSAGASGAGTSGGRSGGGAGNNAGAAGLAGSNAGNSEMCDRCDTAHSLLESCTLDGGCVYSGCVAGFVDCTTTAPNLNGCACRGNACCANRCQTAHDNGVGDTFYDCEALQTYTAEQALSAADADTAQPGTASDHWVCGDDQNGLTGVCKTNDGNAGSCTCWAYAGTGSDIDRVGHVKVSATGGCICPTASSPTWD